MKRPLTVALILAASPALAHHPLAGKPMERFLDGLLSGIGHPVLGFDHLFFVFAVGLMARLMGLPLRAPLAYIAAMLIGCGALYAGVDLPLREPMIAVSLLTIGIVIALGRTPGTGAMLALFAGFGLFHGAAFGTSIATQEGGVSVTVLTGYLIGLGAIQYTLSIASGLIAARNVPFDQDAQPARFAGAMVAGVGLYLCLEALEGPLLALLNNG